MIALTIILKSFLVDPMMLSINAISSNSKLPTITGDDFLMAPADTSRSSILVVLFTDLFKTHNAILAGISTSHHGVKNHNLD